MRTSGEEEREREWKRQHVAGTRGKIGRSDGGSGDKRRPGNHVNCRLSSPGGGSDRNYDWRADGRGSSGTGRREKGKERIGERADVAEWLGVKQEAVPTKRTH